MLTVKFYNYRTGTINTVELNDDIVADLKKTYEEKAHEFFETFIDYVEACCAFNM